MTLDRSHPVPTLSSWYADGFRWIATLFQGASPAPQPLEPHPDLLPPEDLVFELRHRMHIRCL